MSRVNDAATELARQLRRLNKHPIPGISAGPLDSDPYKWLVKLTGPDGTPYEGGWFDVLLDFPSNFPRDLPSGKFETKIWHPNVGSDGSICIDMERSDTSGCAVECVLMGLHMLLATPNPDSPLNGECARQFKTDRSAYNCKAAEMTRSYAM